MRITLAKTGKRYNQDWIFRNIDLTLETGANYVILGSNGSGKSTLLQTISGFITPSEGSVTYSLKGQPIPAGQIFRHLCIASPYLELVEDLTLDELVSYQSKFKRFIVTDVPMTAGLEKVRKKEIKYYSSGMKQRVKLALAILSDCPLLLLDEPVSNLDSKGIEWYKDTVARYAPGKLIVVCSNRETEEYEFCNKNILIEDYKP